MRIYLVGSLKDPSFPTVAEALRDEGYDVFDDWRGAGPDGDARWREYELNERGRSYHEAVYEAFAENGRQFDTRNIERSDAVVATCQFRKLPGRSAIAELGYAKRMHIPTFILLNGDPEDWDLMLPLVARIVPDIDDLLGELAGLTLGRALYAAAAAVEPPPSECPLHERSSLPF